MEGLNPCFNGILKYDYYRGTNPYCVESKSLF